MTDDLISRQVAIAYAISGLTREIDGENWIRVSEVRENIKVLPSAQPEIVRCKECKWKQGSECVRFADVRPFPDDFCSRAERRTDG